MIYVHFPHPSLETHAALVAWDRKKAAGQTLDWTDLFDWLILHTSYHYKDFDYIKCWYSEAEIGGKWAKEVEHFRPKNRATLLTPAHEASLKVQYPDVYPLLKNLFTTPLSGGYPWLEFTERKNYRLAAKAVNATGSKGTVFPVLAGTRPLQHGQMPDVTKEYAILLDPAIQTDAALLQVNAEGRIEPTKAFSAPPASWATYPEQHWNSDWLYFVRSAISIVVYDLNHEDHIRARKIRYHATLTFANDIVDAIHADQQILVIERLKNLKSQIIGAVPFCLAARSACRDFIDLPQPGRNAHAFLQAQSAVRQLIEAVITQEAS